MPEPPKYPPPPFRFPMPPFFPFNSNKQKYQFPPETNLNKHQGIQEKEENIKHPTPPPYFFPHFPPHYGMPYMPPPHMRPNHKMPIYQDRKDGKGCMMPPPYPPMMPRPMFPPKYNDDQPAKIEEKQQGKQQTKQKEKINQQIMIEQTLIKSPEKKNSRREKREAVTKVPKQRQEQKKIQKKKSNSNQVFPVTKKIKKELKIQFSETGRETRKKKNEIERLYMLLMKQKNPRELITKIGKEHQAHIPSSYTNHNEYFLKEMLPKKQSLLSRLVSNE